MGFPKIVYPSGGGTTLTFVFPARLVPAKNYSAVRHDNVASSGVVERIYETRHEFLTFTMEYVKIGADVTAWDTFIQSALQGVLFDYYPDAALGAFTTYALEHTDWTAAYKSLGMYDFSLMFRKYVAAPAAPITPAALTVPAAPSDAIDNVYDVLTGTATVSVVDGAFVTMLDITGPILLTQNILATANIPNGSGAATISWRVTINGVVVETRTGLAYTDTGVERFQRLLLRGPDDADTALSTLETTGGECGWLACSGLKVERKVTAIGSQPIVVKVRTAGVYLDPGTVVENPTGMSTITGARAVTAVDADYVTICSYVGPGVLCALGWISEIIDAISGASQIRCLIDNIEYNLQTGAGNTSLRYFPIGPIRGYGVPDGPVVGNPGNISTIFAWPNVRFRSSIKLQCKVTSITAGKTLTYNAKALIMTYA